MSIHNVKANIRIWKHPLTQIGILKNGRVRLMVQTVTDLIALCLLVVILIHRMVQ